MLKIVFFIPLLFVLNSFAHSFENPSTWHDPQITHILTTSNIKDIEPMKIALEKQSKKAKFDGEVYLVTLDKGIKAVFKSLPSDDQGDATAEVAAYKASLYLGFPYIPPTVLRKINGMQGSLQLFVSTPIDLLVEKEYERVLKEAPEDDIANLRIFYFVFGQWDSGPHNLLAYKDRDKIYLIAIDNAGVRNHQRVRDYGSLPFVRVAYSDKFNTNDWDKPFPFDKARVIGDPAYKNLKTEFGNKLPGSFYKNFNYYNQPLRYVIYNNSLWRQYHAFDENFIKAYSQKCPAKAIKALKSLDASAIRLIFNESKGLDFFNDSYIDNLIIRRDLIINACAK